MVKANLTFISPLERYQTEVPYFLKITRMSGPTDIESNLKFSTHGDIDIHDMREDGLDKFSLDTHSFTVLNHSCDLDLGINNYIEEVIRLLTTRCNATHVLCYDYRVSYASRTFITHHEGSYSYNTE